MPTTEEKAKIVEFKDGKIKIEFSKEIDTNKDGEPVAGVSISLWVDLAEIPDEALSAWKAKKAK